MNQHCVQSADGSTRVLSDEGLVAMADEYHRTRHLLVRKHVAAQCRKPHVGAVALRVGTQEFFEFVYGPNAILAGNMDHNAFLRSQDKGWIAEFFSEDRVVNAYGCQRYVRQ